MRRLFIFGILSVFLVLILTLTCLTSITAFAHEDDDIKINAEEISSEIFGDKKIKTAEYLYGFDAKEKTGYATFVVGCYRYYCKIETDDEDTFKMHISNLLLSKYKE